MVGKQDAMQAYPHLSYLSTDNTVLLFSSSGAIPTIHGYKIPMSYLETGNKALAPSQPPRPAPSPPIFNNGGSATSPVAVTNKVIMSLLGIMSESGMLVDEVEMQSIDAKLKLIIPNKTTLKNKIGQKVSSITIATSNATWETASNIYDISPGGFTVSPNMAVSISFAPIDSQKIAIGKYNDELGGWEALDFNPSVNNGVLTFKVTTSGRYVLLKVFDLEAIIR